MDSFHRNMLFTAALALTGAACGGDGGTPPSNSDPVAAFNVDEACGTTSLTCTFTDASTDADGDETITAWSWTIEGAPDPITEQSPTYTFPANGTYTVSLTVTDDQGATGTTSEDVVINVADANNLPTAAFTFVCEAETCTFTDGSTDPDGDETITAWSWDFGDDEVSTEQSPVHTYAGITVLDTFNVTLTVTDDQGASNSITQEVAVAPPAGTVCDDGSGDFVPCTLEIEADAVVTVTLTSRDCTASGNSLLITNPIQATVFTDGCSEPVGQDYILNGGTAFTAGTQLEVQMISGSDDPNRIAPAIRVEGTYPDWVLNFDDGEDPDNPNEPDFDDIVLTVHAEP
jgi:PKD repeat protein